MQPGYPGSGQDPYGQQPPYVDPYAQPQYSPQGQQSQQPPQEEQPPQAPQYQDPYAQPTPPTSGAPYPPAAPYPMAGYGAPMGAPPQQNNTLGLVGMILGIVSIPLACCPLLGFFAGVAGIVLGVLGLKKAKTGEATNRVQALFGVICGAVGVVVSIGWFFASLALHIGNMPTTV